MKTRTKIFWILWTLSIVSAILILPYIFTLQSEALQQATVPFPLLVLAAVIQGAVALGVAAFFGLILAEKTGFGLPLLSAWLEHKRIRYAQTAMLSVISGLIAGALILMLDRFVFPGVVPLDANVPLWQGFLASFYGGIAEEIVMRLFLMSLFVFVIMKITRRERPGPVNVWSSIILISVLFGLGHLPITSEIVSITPTVVLRAILLNGVGGVVFGWLYWKKGLESAIISHFSADIVLHVIGPALLG